MRFDLKYNIVDPRENETREIRRFAWLPVLIDSTYVWLEKYTVLQGYIISRYQGNIPVIEKDQPTMRPVMFIVGKWTDLSKVKGTK